MTNLSAGQIAALDAIESWYDTALQQVFYLAGPAGTGKTTIARLVPAQLGLRSSEVIFGAYTGKAVQVLRSKGCEPAQTLHSLIYTPQSTVAEGLLAKLRERLRFLLAPAEIAAARQDERRLIELARSPEFVLNPNSDLAEASLLILDEVSMVGGELGRDLESFGVPILVLGDPYQLQPIGDSGHFTKHEPDHLLTEIHRQAEGSPVLDLATRIRTGGALHLADYTSDVDLLAYDQVLCGRKATRWSTLTAMRRMLGAPFGRPVAGDRIMCLRNSREAGLYNGQLFTVTESESAGGLWRLAVTDDAGMSRVVHAPPGGFISEQACQEQLSHRLRGPDVGHFTFAQVITVHKAQGSEWRSVALMDESWCWARSGEQGNWLYTGITRAAERLTVVRA